MFEPDLGYVKRSRPAFCDPPPKPGRASLSGDICPPPPGTFVLISMKNWLSLSTIVDAPARDMCPPPPGTCVPGPVPPACCSSARSFQILPAGHPRTPLFGCSRLFSLLSRRSRGDCRKKPVVSVLLAAVVASFSAARPGPSPPVAAVLPRWALRGRVSPLPCWRAGGLGQVFPPQHRARSRPDAAESRPAPSGPPVS